MKKMNTLLSALTIAVMALTPVAAFAADPAATGGFDSNRNTIDVSVSEAAVYSVNIPDTNDSALADGKEFKVEVTATLAYGRAMVVTVNSKNGWQLKDVEHPKDNSIGYNMSVNGTKIEGNNVAVLEAPYNAKDHKSSVALVVGGLKTPDYAGTYSDQLTFTITEEDVGAVELLASGNQTPDPPAPPEIPDTTENPEISET